MRSANKLYALQVVRAFAAIAVVLVHALWSARDCGIPAGLDVLNHTRDLGACGVDLFFVLSGLVVSLSAARRPQPLDFLKRRAIRILPFFWIVAAAFVLFQGRHLKVGQYLWLPFLIPSPLHPYDAPLVPNTWTLVYELFFYFCLYLGLRVKGRDPRLVCAAIVGFAVLAQIVVHVVTRRDLPILTYYGSPIVVEFLFGVALGMLLDGRTLSRRSALTLLGIGCGGLLATGVVGYGEIFDHFAVRESLTVAFWRVAMWGVPATFIIAGAAALAWSPRSWLGRTWVYLGDACYSIYLVQWIPIEHMRPVLRALSGVAGNDSGVLLFVAFTTAFGTLVYTFVEKPVTRFCERRFVPRRGADSLPDAGIAPSTL